MICKICGQDIGNKGFCSHLRIHHIKDKDYYDTYVLWNKLEVDNFIDNFTNYIS